jgi:hypothetical protein
MVSIVVAVLAAAVAVKAGLLFGALLAAFFVYSNLMTVRSARELDKVDLNQRLVQLLWAGRRVEARDLLADQPADAAVHPLVRAVVRAASDDPGGRSELEAAVGRAPSNTMAVSLLVLSHRTREDWPAVRDLVAAGAAVDPGTVLAAQTVSFQSGAKLSSAQIGQAWLDHAPADALRGDLPGLIAYNTACGWAGVGELDRGLAAFQRAAELGFADLTMVDSDDDIAPLRPMPGYDGARQQIRRRALAAAEPGESPARDSL